MENQKQHKERYISIEQSIVDACREVREMRAGRQPEPTMEDFFAEMNALIEQEKAHATDTYKKIQGRY